MLRRSTALLVSIAALALPAAAHAAPTITAVTPAAVTIGQTSVVSGATDPVAPGVQVRIERRDGATWTQLGPIATTDAAGAWSSTVRPEGNAELRAVLVADGSMSAATLALTVRAKVLSRSLLKGKIYPYLGTRATWRIAPATYTGPVRVQLALDKKDAGWVRGMAKGGKVSVKLPTNGVGMFRAKLVLPDTAALAGTTDPNLVFGVRGRNVSGGAPAMWVKSLRKGLNFRGIYTPASGGFNARMGDAVIAFHKAYGRPRTTSFSTSDWKLLAKRAVKPRYGGDGMHIEIDKSRQILMQVTNGKPTMLIHISSGATGNTPAGRHKIQWKGNWVPSLYGSLLYKSMAFQGAYAIHGYPSVPTTAASHGCVRVPMWIAAKLYSRSPVGTAVYVYGGPGSTIVSVGRDKRAAATPDLPELTGVDPAVWADETL